MKKILLSLVILSSDYSKANKALLIDYIATLEDQLSQALTSLNDLIVREKTIIDSIDAKIATVFDKDNSSQQL